VTFFLQLPAACEVVESGAPAPPSHSPSQARRRRNHLFQMASYTTSVDSTLEEYPDSGRKIPEFPELPYLEVVIGNYRFFYRVESDVVWIVAVWHGAQLPSDPAGHA
jgi:plasmid stabilization system protein ParE